MATKLADELRRAFNTDYDETGSIGKRYRRQDEVGTPFCVTVDGESANDQSVTIRERDSLVQVRVAMDQVRGWVQERIAG
ncbi:MAG: His/Gly/Thr/Pro-type tRNA ligase C-terminal domain-containing protein [Gemmatimonadaceae bacterium]|nr:His/Gly/Thr/Pro-type tRNA ligase C-terminal domain-containing protein [Gemmatimonadaceae bacterium]